VDPERTYRTPRLLLRPWRDDDRAPFAAMSADPAVMEYFPSVLDRAGSDALIDRLRAHFAARGYGFWAVEAPGVAPFIGLVGLLHQTYPAPWTPGIEIGWRIARPYWGQRYAPEAAAEALRIGFEDIGADQLAAITVPANLKSRRVMTKLGMIHDEAGSFDHPELPAASPLRRHVLYRLTRERWLTGAR
jgi:RimJ/RimL family protein N-acetyltransferase